MGEVGTERAAGEVDRSVAVLGPLSGRDAGEQPLLEGRAGPITPRARPVSSATRPQGRDRCTGRGHQQVAR